MKYCIKLPSNTVGVLIDSHFNNVFDSSNSSNFIFSVPSETKQYISNRPIITNSSVNNVTYLSTVNYVPIKKKH